MVNEIVNASSGITSMTQVAGVGWIITIVVFISILLCFFLVLKNFRKLIYGSICTGILLGFFAISRWIGKSSSQGDYVPIRWFAYSMAFIVVAIIIGHFISKAKFVQKLESQLETISENPQ